MSLVKRWVARCDEPGCAVVCVLEYGPSVSKWDVGEALNDAGWQAGPRVRETYCPEHHHEHFGALTPAEIAAREAADAVAARDLAKAFSEAVGRQRR